MFMCKTRMSAGKAWLWAAITVSRSRNRKIYLRGSKQDNMIRQSEKFQLFWSSRLGGDRVRKISISRYFDIKLRYFELEIENSKSGCGDLLVSPWASICVIFTGIGPLSCSLYNTQETYYVSCVLKWPMRTRVKAFFEKNLWELRP